ncbi:hypothetical protein HYT26_03550 [Candidatus Pacearchaeota archaeon]|nr:hypothetical protein [Candidatus Pacearchaeota archaeon]
MEEPILTKEHIEAAKLDVNHPVVQVLISMQDYCKQFNEEYVKVWQDNKLAQEFLKQNIAPLADKINELDEFSLKPLDIISIWSQVGKSFSGLYIRYDLANIIPAKYGVIGIKSPKWREFIIHESKSKGKIVKLPEYLMNDKENMPYFYRRLGDVRKSLDEIDFYRNGVKENIASLARKAFKYGDKEAEKRYSKIAPWTKEHDDSFLGGISENFGNGFGPLLYFMPDEIRKQIFVED